MMAQEKARKKTSEIRKVTPTPGSKRVCHIFLKSKSLPFFTSPICWLVSGRKRAVKMAATRVTAPAIMNGRALWMPMVKAAIAGPNTKPKLKAEPMKPKAPARSSGLVESETTANTTGIFPAVSPSRARERKRKSALGAIAIRKNEAAVPMMEMRSMGRRPYLSDKRPMMGVEMNWQIE